MLNSKLSRSALSLILAVMLVFSIFTLGVFAETEAEDVVEVETDAVTDGSETAADDAATDDGHDHDHEHEDETEAETAGETEKEEEKKGLSTFDIVTIIIFAVLVIIGAVYCLKNREKVGKFLRSLRSEFKKISWSSWKDVRKNTFVVLVVVVAVALVIAFVDFIFHGGITGLKDLLS